MTSAPSATAPQHGSRYVSGLRIDCYSLALREGEGYVGDRARSKAFQQILDHQRAERRKSGSDPLGHIPSGDRERLDAILGDTDHEGAALIREAIETFAGELADVVRHFLETDTWKFTQRIAVGGGLRENDVGEVAIRRACTLLKDSGSNVDLCPIHNDPDEAALLGAAHLCPTELSERGEAILAVDIGGGSIRTGVVLLNQAPDLGEAEVLMMQRWRHREEKPTRDAAVARLCEMLTELKGKSKADQVTLAPFVGIACPGEIRGDGTIVRGAHNLPGDWEAEDFNLAQRIQSALPDVDGAETLVLLHNDAVLHGLSEIWHMRDAKHWGVLTIGTGLGNARFTRDF